MQHFDVKRGSRRCSISDHLFEPGEVFYSALVHTEQGTVRYDYSYSGWEKSGWGRKEDQEDLPEVAEPSSPAEQPQQGGELIGWWKQRVPDLETGKVYWAPDHVLLAWFDSLQADEDKQDRQTYEESSTAWVMALLLLQKRLLTRRDTDSDTEILDLISKHSQREYRLLQPKPELTSQQIAVIQNQLAENLFSDRPALHDDDSDNS